MSKKAVSRALRALDAGAEPAAAPEPAGGESPPTWIRLDDPTPLLSWIARNHGGVFSLATLKRFEVWGVVATATLARSESSRPLTLTDYDRSAAGKFAYAIGSEDLVRAVAAPDPGEPGRTAKLRRLTSFGEIDDAAREISQLLVRNEEERDTRLTVKYVVVELLRNVIQHSNDKLGGVVAAQRVDHQDPSSPAGAKSFVVQYTSENTEQAEAFAREQLEPRILRKEAVVLDFRGMEIATQSYLHALLYDALRLAWAKQSFIYVVNASPSVRSGIELIEAYALGG